MEQACGDCVCLFKQGFKEDDGQGLHIHNLAEKERKAEERKAEKARKIARDAELRRKRAEIAEKKGQ